MAAFTPGIPFDGQTLGNSKVPVRDNFTSLYDAINVEHYPPNDANVGKHKDSIYHITALVPPNPTTVADENAIYNTIEAFPTPPATIGTTNALVYRKPNSTGVYLEFVKDFPFSLMMPQAMGAMNNAGVLQGYYFNVDPVLSGYNAGTLTYTIDFVNALANTNYMLFITPTRSFTAVASPLVFRVPTKTTAQFTIQFLRSHTATADSAEFFSFMVFGGF